MIQNIAISVFAGLASFLTPCIFPLIPAYLAYITGVSYQDLREEKFSRFVIVVKTLLFISGFSLVFILLGMLASGIGNLTHDMTGVINGIAGAVVILFGLHFLFDFIAILNKGRNIRFRKIPAGYPGAFLIGVAFGAGWTPCIGPFLGMLFVLASTGKTAIEGIVYFTCYSAGLGIPFILAGIFFSFFVRFMKRILPFVQVIKKASGVFLICVGILILLGSTEYFNEVLMRFTFFLENTRQTDPDGTRLISGLIVLIPALLIAGFYIAKLIKERKIILLPFRLFFFFIFLLLAILVAIDIIDMTSFFVHWLNYRGYEGFLSLPRS
ncbi:MAG: hypothetical protein JW881_11100 [Spirochaetales bacterium]|nr:hypothetical protein [Spirochaetales bacterium]